MDPIADRFAVQDVMTRYAAGVDNRDLALHESCFTEDVVVSGFAPDREFNGRAAWMEYVRNALERFSATQHLISNHAVELHGDHASLRTYVQATHLMATGPQSTFVLWATYHTNLRRTASGWRIVAHRLEPKATHTFKVSPSATQADQSQTVLPECVAREVGRGGRG